MRDRFPWIAAATYALLFFALGAWRYAVHRNFVDFGIFLQTSRSAFGCFCNAVEGSHWSFHFSPILYVAGAALALFPSPLTLVALQSIACAATLPSVYAIVRPRAGRSCARLAACVVFLYPPLAGLAFDDFHENVFAPAAVAAMLWAFDAGRLRTALAAAIAAICVKEDQALFVTLSGFFGAIRYRGTERARAARAAAGAGIVAMTSFFAVIRPHAAANPAWSPVRFYSWTVTDADGLFPAGLLARAGYALLAFAPLLFLPFRSSVLLLAAAPFAEVMLSRLSSTYTMGSHYAGAWLGYVLAAFAFAVRDLGGPGMRRALFWCIALCLVEFAVADPLHPGLNLRRYDARDAALDRVLRRLPPNLSIATQEEAFTHIALTDSRAEPLPESPSAHVGACTMLVDEDFRDSPRLQEYGAAIAALVRSNVYRQTLREGAIALYSRARCF